MSPHHGMADGVDAMEVVQHRDARRGVRDAIDRDAGGLGGVSRASGELRDRTSERSEGRSQSMEALLLFEPCEERHFWWTTKREWNVSGARKVRPKGFLE